MSINERRIYMRKFLSVLLSLVLVFNASFSTALAQNNSDSSTKTSDSTTVVGDIEVTDLDSSKIKSPIMHVTANDGSDKVEEVTVEYADGKLESDAIECTFSSAI